ncbi:thiamine pyrophosphokinase-related protein [Xylariaceae sp. FL0594]|nr:thiamine pyrophosphokinase-related protein [Xylariaceae sp. FL0594]
MKKTLVEIIDECDDFLRPDTDPENYQRVVNTHYYHFRVHPYPVTLGYVLPGVAEAFAEFPAWELDREANPRTLTLWYGRNEVSRTHIVRETIEKMHQRKTFGILHKLRGELKPIYGPGGELICSIERAAFPLLGIVAYGVHLIAYTTTTTTTTGDSKAVDKIWVSKRGKGANGYHGRASEEAGLPKELVDGAQLCSAVSYFHIRKPEQGPDPGLLHPGVQFVYELVVNKDFMPTADGKEVESFQQLGCKELLQQIIEGKVKPFFTLVLIDFLLRHGAIDEKEEKNMVEISMRLHRRLEFPVSSILVSEEEEYHHWKM